MIIPAAVFVAIYAVSPIAIATGTSAWASRHLAPLQILGLLLVAVAVSRIPRGVGILGGLVLLGAIGHASLLGAERPGRAWTQRADSYYHLGMLWTMRAGRTLASLDVVQVRLERLALERRDAAYRGAIEALEPADHELTPATLTRWLSRLPRAQHPTVWESLGRWLGARPGVAADELAALLDVLPPRGRRLACEALELSRAHRVALTGWSALEPWTSTPPAPPCVAEDRRLGLGYLLATYRHPGAGCPALRKAVADLDQEQRRAVYRGAGRGAAVVEIARTGLPAGVWITGIELGDVACLRQPARRIFRAPDGVATLAAAVPSEHLDDFFRGVGWEIADLFSEDPRRVADTIEDLSQAVQPAARDGAADASGRLRP